MIPHQRTYLSAQSPAPYTLQTLNLSDHPEKPPRDITIALNTVSGSIDTELHHSSFTSLSTVSGRMIADLYPLGPTMGLEIHLANTSGSITLTLHPSPFDPSSPLRSISTTMRGACGRADFIFAANWEGNVKCQTMTGTTKCNWPGLESRQVGTRFGGNERAWIWCIRRGGGEFTSGV